MQASNTSSFCSDINLQQDGGYGKDSKINQGYIEKDVQQHEEDTEGTVIWNLRLYTYLNDLNVK